LFGFYNINIVREIAITGSKNRGKPFSKKFTTIYYSSVVVVRHHTRSSSTSAESNKSYLEKSYINTHTFVLCCVVKCVDLSLMSVILTLACTPNILSYVRSYTYIYYIHIYIYIYIYGDVYLYIYIYGDVYLYIRVVCPVYTQIQATHSKFIREKPFIYWHFVKKYF